MNILFLATMAWAISAHAAGQDPAASYAISEIPQKLLEGASVVKRNESVVVEIYDETQATIRRKYAYTILNPAGDDAAGFDEYYDRLHEIRSVEGRLYDANGKEIRKLKSRDIKDLSGVSQSDLMNDYRIKSHNFHYSEYPYTVEYEFETRYKSMLSLPGWAPRDDYDLSVQQSSFTVIYPQNYTLRQKVFNYDGQPVESADKNKRSLTWTAEHLPAVSEEFASPNWHSFNPVVMIAPSSFSVEGFTGKMDTWENFARFTASLKKGKDQLPEPVKLKVKELTASSPGKREKVQALYQYLQSNTRYISVQLGIGGWMPFDAGYVARNAYGDCKALSNYMTALLKEAGIESYYTLVRAGKYASDIVSDFPSQQFNHVIVCVPMEKDSIWLECTSQTTAMGYLGGFTGNRNALLIGEEGGKLVRTPFYNLQDNLQRRITVGSITASGDLTCSVETDYKARQQDELHSMVNSKSKDELKEYLQKNLPLATYHVTGFDYSEKKSALPVVTEKISLSVRNYATITGKRMFVTPNVLSKDGQKLKVTGQRLLPVSVNMPYRDVDTVKITLPEGYKLESGGGGIKISSLFGNYTSHSEIQDKTLVYYRDYQRFSGEFLPAQYPEMVKFLEEVYQADRARIVLVKE